MIAQQDMLTVRSLLFLLGSSDELDPVAIRGVTSPAPVLGVKRVPGSEVLPRGRWQL